MDLRFWWLKCRESQQKFRYYWAPEKDNWDDYSTKHHPPVYHEGNRERCAGISKAPAKLPVSHCQSRLRKKTCKMRWSRIKHEHISRRKLFLWLQQEYIVTIYLHSVTLARVMSQTIDLRIDRLSLTHSYYWPHVFYLQHQTQEPVNQSLVSSAARALIISLRHFLPTNDALYIA